MSATPKYTQEQVDFLTDYAPTHTLTETWEKFFDEFEVDISEDNIRYLLYKYDIPYQKKHVGRPKMKYSDKPVKSSDKKSNQTGISFKSWTLTIDSHTNELMNYVMENKSMNRKDFYGNAINHFLAGDKIVYNAILRFGKRSERFKRDTMIHVLIPKDKVSLLESMAKENHWSVGSILYQSIIDYCMYLCPEKRDDFFNAVYNSGMPEVCKKSKKSSEKKYHKWTEEEVQFLRKYAPDTTYGELIKKFNEHFSLNINKQAMMSYMQNHSIHIGIREDTNNLIKLKNAKKYQIDGMDELHINGTDSKKEETEEQNPAAVLVSDHSEYKEPVAEPKQETSIVNPQVEEETTKEDREEKADVQSIKSSETSKSNKQVCKYLIPHDIPKMIEKIRKITGTSRYEFFSCAFKYYFANPVHVEKKLRVAKYSSAMWINSHFVYPIQIDLHTMNEIETAASQFHCKSTAVVMQALFDYCIKMFDIEGISIKYRFESEN